MLILLKNYLLILYTNWHSEAQIILYSIIRVNISELVLFYVIIIVEIILDTKKRILNNYIKEKY